MENDEIKQYIINFVEKKLNDCESFVKVYGKEFARKRLEVNLDNIYTDVSKEDGDAAWYDIENSCMTIFFDDKPTKPLTVTDIESNKSLQGIIFHEAVHAIFKKTKEECEVLGIESGTGILEIYHNRTELGRGSNEGLTQWICQKAGYPVYAYREEVNVIRIIELAIGEEAVMQLAKGDIRGNVAQLLQMTEKECICNLALIDGIYKNARRVQSLKNNEEIQDEILDKCIAHFEAGIFEKYFETEIKEAQNSQSLPKETMQRFSWLNFCIQGGKTETSKMFDNRLALKFKNEIYPELLVKEQEIFIAQLRKNRIAKAEQEKINLPVVYKKNWFQKFKEAIKNRFVKETKQEAMSDKLQNQDRKSKQRRFKEYINNMSNYSERTIITNIEQLEEHKNLEIQDEQNL